MIGTIVQVIIFIIILYGITAALKSASKDSGRRRRENGTETPYRPSGSPGARSVPHQAHPYASSGAAGQRPSLSGPSAARSSAVQPSAARSSAVQPSAVPAGTAAAAASCAAFRQKAEAGARAGDSAKAAGSAGKETEEMSTLEYLNRKAREDAREHAEQKLEERRQARIDLAGRREGLRLLPGDPVPQGMRVSVCPYCGAENLIPQGSRDKFGCYFCREDLK